MRVVQIYIIVLFSKDYYIKAFVINYSTLAKMVLQESEKSLSDNKITPYPIRRFWFSRQQNNYYDQSLVFRCDSLSFFMREKIIMILSPFSICYMFYWHYLFIFHKQASQEYGTIYTPLLNKNLGLYLLSVKKKKKNLS